MHVVAALTPLPRPHPPALRSNPARNLSQNLHLSFIPDCTERNYAASRHAPPSSKLPFLNLSLSLSLRNMA